jgi:uncharacterized protein
MDFIIDLFGGTLQQVGVTFLHNWPFLLVSILIAVLLKLYIDPQKVSAFLIRYQKAGVAGATAAAVATPLCSCGTTAIILGMMASTMPWAPIVAFMVASPLTSPEELVYSAGLFGWPFALVFFGSSIVLGLSGGAVAGFAQKRGWLNDQARYDPARVKTEASAPASACTCSAAPAPADCGCTDSKEQPTAASNPSRLVTANSTCGCSASSGAATDGAPIQPPVTVEEPVETCGCENTSTPASPAKVTAGSFAKETFETGRRLLVMFFGFAFIGYFLNSLIPDAWVSAIFGSGSVYSVPLAATLGLPLYINSEASLPLVRALIDGGMSQGAAMAFLITGAGTSVGALMGALTIARWRVIALVVGVLWVGAVVMGYLYNVLLAMGVG